jgi:hypothetical protein
MDQLFHALSRILAVKGTRFSDVFELPLITGTVIRGLLAEEHADRDADEPMRNFNEALEVTEATARTIACRFLDVFQEDLSKRIDNHNNYLAQIQKESGVDLTSFKIATDNS